MTGNLRNKCLFMFVYLTVILVITAEPNTDMNANQALGSSFLNEDRYLLSPLSGYRYPRYDADSAPYFMKRRTGNKARLLNLLQKMGQSTSTVNKRPFDSISYQDGLGGLL